jgi:subtilisin
MPMQGNLSTVSEITDIDGKYGGQGPDINGRLGIYKDDTLALFSNHGPVVDIAAPGISINSTSKNGDYITDGGTSMAAPNVAGAAASFIASNRVNDPSPSDALIALINSTSNSETECDGSGRGYFTADRNAFPEPLLYTASTNQSWPMTLNQTQNIPDQTRNISVSNMTTVVN